VGTLVYLDIDDEVTTAATRIREAGSDEVALVVPSGSRIATSRMNFRLLARAAQEQRRSLVIVGPDPATRSMAEAAGLTAYGTVAQYEEADAAEPASGDLGPAALAAATAVATPSDAPAPSAGGVEPSTDDAPADRTPAPRSRGKRASKGAAAGVAAGAAAGAAAATGAGPSTPADEAPAPAAPAASAAPEPVAAAAAARAEGPTATDRPATLPVRGGVRAGGPAVSPRGIAALVVTVAVALAGLLAVVVVLPSATITITPRTTTVGPVEVEVRADPAVSEVDVAAGVVPAQRPEIPLSASGSFEATGKKVDETKAAGTVTFTSKDPTRTNRIPAGSVVSTSAGIGFRTLAAVTVPKAKIEGLTIIPGRINVRVDAVKAGPEGNVSANAITVVPAGQDPVLTAVTNAAPTEGGTRTETIRVTADDVDAAVGSLSGELDRQLAAAIVDPAVVPPPLVAYPETVARSEPVPSVDPGSLVGQEVETFDLALTATGSVTLVDPSLVEAVTEARVVAAASPDADLVPGSTAIEVGEPIIDDVALLFPTSGQADETSRLDAETIKEEALGKPVDEAMTQLSRYGEVEITTWPDWVTSVPTLDARVEVTITTQAEAPGASAAPTPAASTDAPTPAPEATQ
jgi:hypothetical protein